MSQSSENATKSAQIGQSENAFSPEKVAQLQSFFVNDWQVDVAANRLRRENDEGKDEIKIETRVMEVLLYLASRPGVLVTREEIERDVWAGRVVSYESLTSSINKLRKAFGDNPRNPRFIETVSKKGYRMIAVVNDKSTQNNAPQKSSGKYSVDSVRRIIITLVVGLVIGLVIFLIGLRSNHQVDDTSAPISRVETQSLMVLPFVDISSDSSKRYLGDGLAEDVTTSLSKISGLFVIARSSAMTFKGQPVDVKKAAKQMDVHYVVEGSVQREGENLRVNVKLIDGYTGFHLWAQQYDREVTDIFTVQDDITQKIVSALSVKLTEEEKKRTARRYTVSFDAYDLFLRGQVYYVRHNKEDNLRARDLYLQSIELDPQFARAYSARALTYSADYRYAWRPDQQVALQSAQKLAEKAVSIDKQLPQAHWVLGYVYLHQRKYDEAIKAAKRAIKLNPNFADGYATLGVSYIYAGDPQNGILMMQRAMRLSPQYPAPYASAMGQAYYFLGKYEDALPMLNLAIERNVNLLTSHVYLIASLSRLEKNEEASWAAIQLITLMPDFKLNDIGKMFPIKDKEALDSVKSDLRSAGIQ